MRDLDFRNFTDQQRRNLHGILDAIGCLRCSSLVIRHGRNANSYDCSKGGCVRAAQALDILRAANEKYGAPAHPIKDLQPAPNQAKTRAEVPHV